MYSWQLPRTEAEYDDGQTFVSFQEFYFTKNTSWSTQHGARFMLSFTVIGTRQFKEYIKICFC